MVRYVYKRGYFTLFRALFALQDSKLVFLTLHHFYHFPIAPSSPFSSKLNLHFPFFSKTYPYHRWSD